MLWRAARQPADASFGGRNAELGTMQPSVVQPALGAVLDDAAENGDPIKIEVIAVAGA